MIRFESIILVQGTLPTGSVNWKEESRKFPELMRHVQANVNEALGADLARFCAEGPDSFSEQQRTALELFLTFMGQWTEWLDLKNHLPGQRKKIRFAILRRRGNTLFVGHSFGFWIAAAILGLWGDFDQTAKVIWEYCRLTSAIRGKEARIQPVAGKELDLDFLRQLCKQIPGVGIAVVNSEKQVFASGTASAIEQLIRVLVALDIRASELSFVGVPWHTYLLQSARSELTRVLKESPTHRLHISFGYVDNNGAMRTTKSPRIIRRLLLSQLTSTVEFWKLALQIPAKAELYELSITGKLVLTGFVEQARAVVLAPQSRLKERVKIGVVPSPTA